MIDLSRVPHWIPVGALVALLEYFFFERSRTGHCDAVDFDGRPSRLLLVRGVLEELPRLHAKGGSQAFERRDVDALQRFARQNAVGDGRGNSRLGRQLTRVRPAAFLHEWFHVPTNHGVNGSV